MPHTGKPNIDGATPMNWNSVRTIARVASLSLLISIASPVASHAQTQKVKSNSSFIVDVCKRIEGAARKWKLPPAFFARLIWRESRFDPNAVSPVGASGIAQFMPGTAKDRKLENPL